MKFSEPNTSLVIGTERMETSLRISLADQGIGLAHVDMDRLFLAFTKVTITVKEVGSV